MATQDSNADDLTGELIGLLHRGAPLEEFAGRLAQVQKLPDSVPRKSMLAELVRMALAVRNRLELLQEREQGMRAVIESAQDLSSRLDLPELLRAIVSRARNLLGSPMAWLSTYDADKQEFQVRVNDGALLQGTRQMKAQKNAGVVSVIMGTRMPFSTPDYLHDSRFPHDPELDDVFRSEGIVALVGVPLIWNEEIVGLLFVADRYHRTHTALNTSRVSALATHAAVAVKNARAFEQAKYALEQADAARAELERHVQRVKSAAEAHEQMTSMLARGAPLSTLCESVAQFLGGAVLVLDEAAQIISRGTAPGYAGTEAPAFVSPHGERSADISQALRLSRQDGRSVSAYQSRGESCRVMAVLGGNDVLGSVLLFHGQELDDGLIRTFERSAGVIGIVLLSQERSEAGRHRDVSTFLRALVSARQDPPALLLDRAERFGLDLSQPVSLIVLEFDEAQAAYAARRLRARPELAHAVLDEIEGNLVLLCASTQAQDRVHLLLNLGRPEFGSAYRGVLSRPVSGPAAIPDLYATLRRALPVLGRMGVRGHIVGQNEMALYSTLFETHDRASLDGFLASTIGALLAQDRKRGSELTRTLLAFFDSHQSAKATAQRLDIHVNTVRQRLATIEELIGSWGDAARALEIHMALRLWNLATPPAR